MLLAALLGALACGPGGLTGRRNWGGGSAAILNADFWIARMCEPERILMSPGEIAAFNETVRERLPDQVYDLAAYPRILPGRVLKRLLQERPLPAESGLYRNGLPAGEGFLAEIARETNLSGVADSNPVIAALTVRRTCLRSFPTCDRVNRGTDDRESDLFQETALDPAEPVLVLHHSRSGTWLFVQSGNYRGWLPSADLAVVDKGEEWLRYLRPQRFLVVTGQRLVLGANLETPALSRLEFAMGARLPLVEPVGDEEPIDNRSPQGNHVVLLPVRGGDGRAGFRKALVPLSADVSVGYLPYTRAGVVRQAFKLQGERYGWGGMFHSWDCSSLVMDVYRCFGLNLPRNSDQQARVGVRLAIGGSARERVRRLRGLPPGTLLHFPGHVMLYLGSHGDRDYVIHAIAARGDPERRGPDGKPLQIPLNGVMVTDLSLLRAASGVSLLDSLVSAVQVSNRAEFVYLPWNNRENYR